METNKLEVGMQYAIVFCPMAGWGGVADDPIFGPKIVQWGDPAHESIIVLDSDAPIFSERYGEQNVRQGLSAGEALSAGESNYYRSM